MMANLLELGLDEHTLKKKFRRLIYPEDLLIVEKSVYLLNQPWY